MWLTIVLTIQVRLPLRAVERLLAFFSQLATGYQDSPHWTTIRLWLLRLGHYKLTCPKPKAEDWVWICDHTVEVGTDKCLAILGIRLALLPPPGCCLGLSDLELIALDLVKTSSKHVVYEQLKKAEQITGAPRMILSDRGGDLHTGIELYLQDQPQSTWIYDIVHKGASLLKRVLEKNARWKEFTSQVGKTNVSVRQTELAFLTPPSQRAKARYMNLESLVRWAKETLVIVENPSAEILRHCQQERLEEKLGWLQEFRTEIEDWSQTLQVIQIANHQVRSEGYHSASREALSERLHGCGQTPSAAQVKTEIMEFVGAEASKAQPGERLPGSSESIESSFGKFKSFKGDHGNGFTSLLSMFGALVSKTSPEIVCRALTSSRTKHVQRWCREKLGRTVQSLRRMAYEPFRRAQRKRDEAFSPSI